MRKKSTFPKEHLRKIIASLLSLALLAGSCLPVLAQSQQEVDSSSIAAQTTESLPSPENENATSTESKVQTPAELPARSNSSGNAASSPSETIASEQPKEDVSEALSEDISAFRSGPASDGEMVEGTLKYTVQNGEATITGVAYYDTYTIKVPLNIPASIGGFPVVAIGDSAFADCAFTTISFPGTLRTIGEDAFWRIYLQTPNLLFIPASVTSIKTDAFSKAMILGFDVSPGNPNYCSQDGVLFNKDKTQLLAYPQLKPELFYRLPDSVIFAGPYTLESRLTKAFVLPNPAIRLDEDAFSYMFGNNVLFIADGSPIYTGNGEKVKNIHEFSEANYQRIPLTGLTFDTPNITVKLGETFAANFTCSPANTTDHFLWYSFYKLSNSSLLQWVDSTSGRDTYKAIAPGTTTITVRNYINTVQTTMTVTVKEEMQILPVDPNGNVERFVTRLYEVTMGRAPDAEGLAYWSSALKQKLETGSSVVTHFFLSDEFLGKGLKNPEILDAIYRALFSRYPDAGGKEYWLKYMDAGVSSAGVLARLIPLEEFASLCRKYSITVGNITTVFPRDKNLPLTLFLSRMYTKVFERAADIGGLDYWANCIYAEGKTPEWVAEQFVFSQEYNNKNSSDLAFIQMLYRSFMGREGETGGMQYWLDLLSSHSSTRQEIFRGFAYSEEFKQIQAEFGI